MVKVSELVHNVVSLWGRTYNPNILVQLQHLLTMERVIGDFFLLQMFHLLPQHTRITLA